MTKSGIKMKKKMKKKICSHCGKENCWHLKCSHIFVKDQLNSVILGRNVVYCQKCNMGRDEWKEN